MEPEINSGEEGMFFVNLNWTKRDTKRAVWVILVAFAVFLLFFAMKNWSKTAAFAGSMVKMFRPFTIGFIMAYLLNAPMMFFERHVFKFAERKKPRPETRRSLAILLTWILTGTVLTFFFWIIIPQVVASVEMFISRVPDYYESLVAAAQGLLDKYHLDYTYVEELLQTSITTEGLVKKMTEYVSDLLPQLANLSMRVGGGLMDVSIGVIISIYLMFSKETLIGQLKKVIYAYTKRETADRLVSVARESHHVFSGFINGKLIDSVIVGVLCYVLMLLFHMDYALLISFLVGVTNVIPFFGPFFGAVPSALILLMVDPIDALWFVVMIFVLQQFDGNILTPKILGDSTGLPALWVMFAILIGGGLFGIMGMLIGVPIFAVIYSLLRESFDVRLTKKGLPTSTNSYVVIKGRQEKAAIEMPPCEPDPRD
jgi:predicted PurR-regulated permease PerM